MKVSFDLPTEVEVTDYHDFAHLEKDLRAVTKLKIKVSEVGFRDGLYVGVVYVGAKPLTFVKELKKTLEQEY